MEECVHVSRWPAGYLHYLANPTCEPARAYAALPTADGGTFAAIQAVLTLPVNVLQAYVPTLDAPSIERFKASAAAGGSISIDPMCAERCAGSIDAGAAAAASRASTREGGESEDSEDH